MQMCARKKEHMKEEINYALRSLDGLLGKSCHLESPRLQQAKPAMTGKHFAAWEWTCVKTLGHEMFFFSLYRLIFAWVILNEQLCVLFKELLIPTKRFYKLRCKILDVILRGPCEKKQVVNVVDKSLHVTKASLIFR